MKISGIDKSYYRKTNIAFKAKEYAIVKTMYNGADDFLRAYEVYDKDINFLELMASRIFSKKLLNMHNLTEVQIKSWRNVIYNAMMMAGFNRPQKTILLAKSNKPCAIMSYKNFNECYLDSIASWPIEQGKKVKLAGTSMINLLFLDCINTNTSKITLNLLKNSTIPLSDFYKSFGFKDTRKFSDKHYDMYINKSEFTQHFKSMQSKIKIQPLDNKKEINLSQILDINF